MFETVMQCEQLSLGEWSTELIAKGKERVVENDTDGKFLRQNGHFHFCSFLYYFMRGEVNNCVV